MCSRILRIQAIVPVEDIKGKGIQMASGGKRCPNPVLRNGQEGVGQEKR